ncbi:MAG: PAS domain S-box protein [Pyrinomonadaceae bacterium]
MKPLFPQTFKSHFPVLLSNIAVLLTAVVLWSIWHSTAGDEGQLSVVHLDSVWFAAVIITMLGFFLAVSQVRNFVLHKTYKTLSVKSGESAGIEETLSESEARYRIVTESASDAIITIDHEHTILFVNPAAGKIFGYTVDEMLGEKLFMLMPEHMRGAHAAGMKRYKETGKRNIPWQGVELPALHKDGHEVPIEVTFGEIKSGDKRFFTAVIRDITVRKQTERSLQESESHYRMLFDSNPNPIFVFDLETLQILAANDESTNHYGYSREEFLEMTLKDLRPPDEVPFLLSQIDVTAASQGKTLHSTRHRKKDGTIIEVEIAAHPIMFGGRPARLTLVTDVTTRKRAEIESRVIHEIIQGLATTSNLEELLALVQQSVGQAIYAENFYVALYDKQTDLLHVPFCEDKFDAAAPPQKLGKGLTAYAFRRGLPTLLTDKAVTELCEQGEIEMVGTPSAIWLGIPLRTPTEIIGVLVVQHYEDESAYTERDIELLSSAGDQIAMAIERKRAEDTLRESEAILAAAQRITHLGSWELDLANLEDLNKNEVRWSDETYRIFGYEPGQVEVTNELFYNSVHPDDRKHVAQVLAEAVEQRKVFNIEHRAVLPDKSERILHGQAELIFDKRTNMPIKLLGTVQDITERRRTNAALHQSEYKLRTLFESMNEGLTQVDTDEVIEFVNDRLCEMTGYTREELLGKVTLDVFFDDEGRRIVKKENEQRQKGVSGQYEARIKRKSGEMLSVLVSGAPVVNEKGIVTGTLGMFMDISERKRVEEQLFHDAFHDGLTGLANRARFMDHLSMTIERCRSRHSNYYAVLFLDFDRFKIINDSLGHAEGDELLKQIACRIETSTRTGDLAARLGGDEFVILLSEMLDADDAIEVAERILADLKNPFELNGNEVFITASIGIALSTTGHKCAEDMLRDADIAMYRAKAMGKARYQIFDQALLEQATSHLLLETEMRQALERGEFEMHYQPIIDLATNDLTGFEALVRWRHPERGMIPPDDFIPFAEESGLILPLGRWILTESCRQLREWQDAYPRAQSLDISVNLSAKQFLQHDLAEQVSETLNMTGLAPRCLKLEITESYLMENSEKSEAMLDSLRQLGVGLSLDDFGTGYSSLSYLHRLPVNNLKIDRSFVSRMTESEENSEIVRTIIRLAQNLKLNIVAEGIETAEQLDQLNNLNCGYGQGYFFSRPLEAEKAAIFINENPQKLLPPIEPPVINLELNM